MRTTVADKLKKKDCEDRLEALHQVLSNLHGWLAATGERVLVILEGCDTAGKTGGINAITHRLNPRRVQVVALSKPSEREAGQWYFQRYVEHLPAAGELFLFDRSWYRRSPIADVPLFVGFRGAWTRSNPGRPRCADAVNHAGRCVKRRE